MNANDEEKEGRKRKKHDKIEKKKNKEIKSKDDEFQIGCVPAYTSSTTLYTIKESGSRRSLKE